MRNSLQISQVCALKEIWTPLLGIFSIPVLLLNMCPGAGWCYPPPDGPGGCGATRLRQRPLPV